MSCCTSCFSGQMNAYCNGVQVKPTVLIGLSGAGPLFTPEILTVRHAGVIAKVDLALVLVGALWLVRRAGNMKSVPVLHAGNGEEQRAANHLPDEQPYQPHGVHSRGRPEIYTCVGWHVNALFAFCMLDHPGRGLHKCAWANLWVLLMTGCALELQRVEPSLPAAARKRMCSMKVARSPPHRPTTCTSSQVLIDGFAFSCHCSEARPDIS